METVDTTTIWVSQRAGRVPLAHLFDRRLALVVLLALFAALLAYQAPPTANLAVGWLGDQLFLPTSQALNADQVQIGSWYGDELTDSSPTSRSRWTRERAVVMFPALGAHRAATLSLLVQGWPSNAVRDQHQPQQPTVVVKANGVPSGQFPADPGWQEHVLQIPAAALDGGDLQLELSTQGETFAATANSATDTRPKGVRVARVRVAGSDAQGVVLPPLQPLAVLMLVGALLYLSAGRVLRPNHAFVLAVALVAALGVGLALGRIWTVVILPWAAAVMLLALVLVNWHVVASTACQFVARLGDTGALSAGLLAAFVGWVAYLLAHVALTFSADLGGFTNSLPDSFLLLLLGLSLIALLLLNRFQPLVRLANALVRAISTPRGALITLSMFMIGWLGYEVWLVAALQGAGHADYSDNAVVARNLVNGRGWVVDYVTQFYKLYPSLTRPQETWPLMQPVWIAPFFALFGAQDWAAKLPNLIFTTLLGVLMYYFGARVWDRRVGLTATVFLLTSYLFVLLVINVTSDLAFVALSFAVLMLVYLRGTGAARAWWWPLVTGVLTGFMLLQKPANGVFVAFGAGVWLLIQIWREQKQNNVLFAYLRRQLMPLALWALIAVSMLSPYLLRNLALSRQDPIYGSLIYSTESRDAWVWGYAPDSDWIYQIYTPQHNLSETQGLPDRSWLLRWGFDNMLAKVSLQAQRTRNYLAPGWTGLPNNLSDALSGTKDGPVSFDPQREDKRLFFGVGAWLAFLGMLIALRRHAKLVGLLMLAFVPYILFLIVYWHADEERYFVALMPWLALLMALALWSMFDRIARIGRGQFAPVALLIVLVLGGQVVGPSWPAIDTKVRQWHYADSDRDAYAWIKANTDQNAAFMTRVPWQFNWYTERPALMLPFTLDRTRFFQLARHYKIRYLSMDVAQRPDTQQILPFLMKRINDKQHPFKLVYRSPPYSKGPTDIYEFPADYGGVPELGP